MKTVPFNEIETGSRFRYQCMFFKKVDGGNAILVSDDKFEAKRAKFVPSRGMKIAFAKYIQVEPVDEPFLIDKFERGFNSDWPAGKHPG